uniref:BZIP domain-containing protein n=2 Tax=Kalanchoe fedtschenkoi TaxID=63787 RepID=A0A7N0VKB3_KALFE
MVVSESDMMSPGEVESPLAPGGEHKNQALTLGRQSSIYSLTLDEFQHTLCDSGKNFGSMNMDEFLNSIWTAEENQAVNTSGAAVAAATGANQHGAHSLMNFGHGESMSGRQITKQPSLPRQGSLTIPAPLCRKTVDEVWSEIHKNQHGAQHASNVQTSGSAHRQPTFGEMTLEDFLVKAGVVREQNNGQQLPPAQQQQYNLYQNSTHPTMPGPGFVTRTPPILAVGGHGGGVSPAAFIPHGGVGVGGGVGDLSGYGANGKNGGTYHAAPYGGRVGNGAGEGGGYGAAQSLAIDANVSPVSSEGMGPQMDSVSGGQYGMDFGGIRGPSNRKRIIDGPVEKVVERRQRRMIKNRESAARSRARKQAYTVELEAELNQLREENAQLRQALQELERKRKQQYMEEAQKRAQAKAHKNADRMRSMRRALSSPV